MEMKEVLDKVFSTNSVPLPNLGRDVKIKRVTLRSLRPILDLLSCVIADMRVGSMDLGGAAAAISNEINSDPASVLKLISKHYDAVMEAVAPLVEDLDKNQLYDLDLDDGALLVQAVLLVNRDFFTKQVAPALKLMAAERASGVQPSGNAQQDKQPQTESAQTA